MYKQEWKTPASSTLFLGTIFWELYTLISTFEFFERSHIPLHKWLYAMYLLQTARKGISSMQLSKELGITQKSAWFLLMRN